MSRIAGRSCRPAGGCCAKARGFVPAPAQCAGAFSRAGGCGSTAKTRGFVPAPASRAGAFSRAGGCGSTAKTRGFTLLEVLVALAILGLVMLALVRVAAQEADSLRHLRERSHAEWIASNAIAEARIGGAIQPGRREGEVEFGGRRYSWLIDVQDTPVAGIRRLDAAVFAPDTVEPVGRMTGFVSAR